MYILVHDSYFVAFIEVFGKVNIILNSLFVLTWAGSSICYFVDIACAPFRYLLLFCLLMLTFLLTDDSYFTILMLRLRLFLYRLLNTYVNIGKCPKIEKKKVLSAKQLRVQNNLFPYRVCQVIKSQQFC